MFRLIKYAVVLYSLALYYLRKISLYRGNIIVRGTMAIMREFKATKKKNPVSPDQAS